MSVTPKHARKDKNEVIGDQITISNMEVDNSNTDIVEKTDKGHILQTKPNDQNKLKNTSKDTNKSMEVEFTLDNEIVELEFDEDSVLYYIVDENDKEIGVCLDENGNKVEYIYEQDIKENLTKTQGNLKNVNRNLNDLKKEASIITKELNNARSEILDVVDSAKKKFKILP